MPNRRHRAGKRYAEAIAGLARQTGDWARWRRDLQVLAQTLAEGPLLQAMQSQRHGLARRGELLAASLGDRVSPEARHLVLVMARHRRLELMPDVVAWFDELADRAEGVQRVTITTAQPLNEAQRLALRQRLLAGGAAGGLVGRDGAGPGPGGAGEVVLSEEVDPSILGGLIVRQADIIQDYSIRARLEALRERLN